MTDQRDADLQALFASQEEELPGEAFTAVVMAQTDRLRRRALRIRILAGLVFIACAFLLATPLQSAVSLLSQAMSAPLFTVTDGLLAQLLLPVNTVAFPVVLVLMALRRVRRRLFA